MKGSSRSPKYSEPKLPIYIHELCKMLVKHSKSSKAKTGCGQVMLHLQGSRKASLQRQEQSNLFVSAVVILLSPRKL